METTNIPPEPNQDSHSTGTMDSNITRLTDSLNKLNSELETIKENIQKRKTESTTMKILFYTGFTILLAGFIYSSTTLQRAQLKNMDQSIALIQKRVNLKLSMIEKVFLEELDRVQSTSRLLAGNGLPESLQRMSKAISLVEPDSEKMKGLITRVKNDSDELSQAYSKYKIKLINARKPLLLENE